VETENPRAEDSKTKRVRSVGLRQASAEAPGREIARQGPPGLAYEATYKGRAR
jgi:hypothetical protein